MGTLDRGSGPRARLQCVWARLFLIAVSLAVFAMASPGQSTPSPVDAPSSGAPRLSGQERMKTHSARAFGLFRLHCIKCHEEDGRGEGTRDVMRRIPDFTRPDWHVERDDDHMLDVILKGKGSMPSMKAKLKSEDATLLVGLVRGFKGGKQVVPDETDTPTDPPKPAESTKATEPAQSSAPSPRIVSAPTSGSSVPRVDPGRALFQRLCVACHGGAGRGDAMGDGMPRPPDFAAPGWQSTRRDAQLMMSIKEGKGSAMPAFGGKLGDAQVRDLVAYVRSFSRIKGSPISKPSSDFRTRIEELRRQMRELDREYRAASSG
jgi:mono/diheme cytochrome c family protein